MLLRASSILAFPSRPRPCRPCTSDRNIKTPQNKQLPATARKAHSYTNMEHAAIIQARREDQPWQAISTQLKRSRSDGTHFVAANWRAKDLYLVKTPRDERPAKMRLVVRSMGAGSQPAMQKTWTRISLNARSEVSIMNGNSAHD